MAYQSETGFNPTKLNSADYGINYDAEKIKSTFDTATAAQYKALQNEQDQTANQYYSNQYNNQAMALDTIRKANAQAVATGASKGMQAANELSSVLNLQQQGTTEATNLAAQQNQLYDKEQSAYAQNAVNALSAANAAGESVYSADTQFNVGQMQYYSAIEQALKNLEGVKYTADKNLEGTQYNADANYSGNKYTADKNYNGTVYNANQNYNADKYTADSSKASYQYTADKNYAGTVYNANANASAQKAAASISANATKYAADTSAAATKAAAAANGTGTTGVKYLDDVLQKAVGTGGAAGKAAYVATLISQGMTSADANKSWTEASASKTTTSKNRTSDPISPKLPTAQGTKNAATAAGQGWLFQ